MQDAIIKGIGNSRYLKTVGEALSLYPTYEDFLQAMIEGTFPVDFNGINKDGWTQQGTPLNKANLLSDTVISTLGLSTGANSTPNDAFNVLANIGNVHVWRKTVVTEEEIPAGYRLVDDNTDRTTNGMPNVLINLGNSNQRTAWIDCASSISVNDGGGVSLNSATTYYQVNDALDVVSQLKEKYIKLHYINDFGNWFGPPALDQNKIYYVPNDAQVSIGSATIVVDKLQRVDAYPLTSAGTHVTYLTSTNRNAYQEGADGSEKPAGYTLGAVKTGKKALSDLSNYIYSVTWQYGDSVAVSDDGKVSIKNPTQISISATNDSEIEKAKVILGKFATPMSNCGFEYGKIYFFPSDSQISRESLPIYDTTTTNIDKYQEVTGYPAIPAGTTIEYLGVLGEKSKIQVLSYVGTGTSGEANPCSVTASFPIKALFFLGYIGEFGMDPSYLGVGNGYWGDGDVGIMFSKCLTTAFTNHIGFDANGKTSFGKKSADGKTFYWYNKTSAVTNDSGSLYYFLALG